ncbi:MAG: protein-tyrosine phosphatase family protein [Candidatus Rokuibacteriota bacterium]
MPLTELPLNLPGRLYRCAMPFSEFDPTGLLLDLLKLNEVSLVVVLAEKRECLSVARGDLLEVYRHERLEVLHLPLRDFTAGNGQPLQPYLDCILAELRAGRRIAVHCRAGKGRAGMFAACLAREALGLSGDEAIAWIRKLVPGSVETRGQEELIRSYRS